MRNSLLYYGGKLLLFVLSVWILTLAVFYIARMAPGDPLFSYYGDRVEKMSPEERERAEARLGLDASVHVQYVRWLKNAFHGDFGRSFKYRTDVLKVIAGRLPNTLILGGVGFGIIFVLALGLGLLCVWHEDGWPDRLICRVGTVTGCIPEFWLSLALILLFSVWLGWFPSSGAYSVGREEDFSDRMRHLVLPLSIVVLSHLWYYAYMIRNRLSEEVRAEYVLLAKSKGLSRKGILFRHCMRNVMPSYLSLMAISAPHILGGTYIIETVFSYPGIGTLAYESARYQDYNLLMVLCILSGTAVILCNVIAQIINERIDPRMRETRKGARGEAVADEEMGEEATADGETEEEGTEERWGKQGRKKRVRGKDGGRGDGR